MSEEQTHKFIQESISSFNSPSVMKSILSSSPDSNKLNAKNLQGGFAIYQMNKLSNNVKDVSNIDKPINKKNSTPQISK